jgi:hypothetical protein
MESFVDRADDRENPLHQACWPTVWLSVAGRVVSARACLVSLAAELAAVLKTRDVVYPGRTAG